MAVKSKNRKKDLTALFILKINVALLKKFGKPKRNLKSNPLDILVATILSQNTNDLNSHKAFLNLKQNFNDYNKLISAKLDVIEKTIKVAGLGKQKAKAIKNFLSELKNRRENLDLNFLSDLSEREALNYLTSFKGIGKKTAACVLLFGLHKNVCPVDTHVHRILNRIGLIKSSNRDKTFEFLLDHLPDKIAHEFHTNLIKLGRTICTSQKPKCFHCPIKKYCNYEHKNLSPNKVHNNMKSSSDFMLLDSV